MALVSFVIPVPPGAYPAQAIEHIHNLAYPQKEVEILIAEGKQPSLQRNIAVAEAKGDLIYFLDDDSYIDPQALNHALKYLADSKIAAVGGPAITCEEASRREGCFGAALASGFGAGPIKSRSRILGMAREVRGEELILCNLLVRKEVYLSSGGLNTALYPNEENEFLKRLRGEGHKFFYVPEMLVRRSRRKEFGQFIKQMVSYGQGRARHIFKSFAFKDLFFLIPSAFLLYLIFFAFFPNWLTAIPLFIYAISALIATIRSTIRHPTWEVFLGLPVVFLIMHLSYGVGIIKGLLNRTRTKNLDTGIQNPVKVIQVDPDQSLSPRPI